MFKFVTLSFIIFQSNRFDNVKEMRLTSDVFQSIRHVKKCYIEKKNTTQCYVLSSINRISIGEKSYMKYIHDFFVKVVRG
jgi:hypothetical protein